MNINEDLRQKSIVMLGAGNLATPLAKALCAKGLNIIQVYSRTECSARRLAELIGCEPVVDIDSIVSDADIYILALTDAASEHLLCRLQSGRMKSLWVNTGACMKLDLFARGVDYAAVMYPLMTFSKEKDVDFSHVPLFIEGNNARSLMLVRQLSSLLSDCVHEIETCKRQYIHLAATLACNFSNYFYVLAADILRQQGLSFNLLLPLIDETVAKVHAIPPVDAQTGPAVRGDCNTMSLHLKLLAEHEEWHNLYYNMSKSINDYIGKHRPFKLDEG